MSTPSALCLANLAKLTGGCRVAASELVSVVWPPGSVDFGQHQPEGVLHKRACAPSQQSVDLAMAGWAGLNPYLGRFGSAAAGAAGPQQ